MRIYSLTAPLLLAFSASLACSAQDDGDPSGSGDGDSNPSTGDGDSTIGIGDGDTTGDGDSTIGIGDGDNTSGDGDTDICQSYQAESERVEPMVMILLDQSGSMKEPRWSHATEAVATAAANLESFAQVGFIGFPTHPISSDSVWDESCAAEVKAVAPSPSATIASSIHSAPPQIGHTPTRAALELAGTEMAKPEYATLAKYIVLITDGIPNCISQSEGWWRPEDPSDTIASLHEQGITTFVVGYQLSSTPEPATGLVPTETANNMAAAGGTDTYREVVDGAALNRELEEIRKLVVPCDFEMNEPPRGGADFVRVTIDGTQFELEVDWVLEGEKTVQMIEGGAACNLLRDGGTHQVSIDVECEPVKVR